MRNEWTVRPAAVNGAEATTLLREYWVEIVGRYHGRAAADDEVAVAMANEPPDVLAPPRGVLMIGRYGEELAGCAGTRLVEPGVAEVKRVFVRPAYRGRGGGAALLAAVEPAARELGAKLIRLDTRADLVEARRLYARNGYRESAPHNDDRYAEHWFAKDL